MLVGKQRYLTFVVVLVWNRASKGQHAPSLAVVIMITAVIFIVQYLTDIGEYTALYKINKNVLYKTSKIVFKHSIVFLARTHARTHAHRHTHTRDRQYTYNTHTHTHTHTHTRDRKHTLTHSLTHSYTHTHTHLSLIHI